MLFSSGCATVPPRFTPGHLQSIITSTYRRTPLFRSARFAQTFVQVLGDLRCEFKFSLIGRVLMPEHFHALLLPQPAESTSEVVKQLKQRTAHRILAVLKERDGYPSAEGILQRLRLPASVHDHSTYRVWQRRFYPFNVYTEKKRLEKVNDMHNNPVSRGLVAQPGDWLWSSWRFYYRGDASILAMDRLA